MTEYEEIVQTAMRQVEDHVRHNQESLYEYLGRLYPDVSDEELDNAIEEALFDAWAERFGKHD